MNALLYNFLKIKINLEKGMKFILTQSNVMHCMYIETVSTMYLIISNHDNTTQVINLVGSDC